MRLFRKHHSPEELGSMIYEALRAGMASTGELSLATLTAALKADSCELHEQHVGEIMVGSMFGAVLAIERSSSTWIAKQIIAGMTLEFRRHLEEQGASGAQVREWEEIVEERFAAFRGSLEKYEGFEPPWKLGRKFLWNLTGTEVYIAIAIKTATMYLLTARDVAQQVLNQYGPTIVVNLST
jgi:hypothetical protein